MRYAQIQDGQIVGFIPTPTRPMFHGRWYDCRDEAIRAEYLAAAGYVPVITTPQPEDTETETTSLSYTVGSDSVTQSWTPRPWTADELAAKQAEADREVIRTAIKAIVTNLRDEKSRAQTVIDATNAAIKSDPGPYVKDCARAAKRIADAAIDLARYVKDL